MTKQKPQSFDDTYVRDISEAVYKDRLGPKQTASMLEKDGAEKLRERAAFYDHTTVATLRAINQRHSIELGIKHEVTE